MVTTGHRASPIFAGLSATGLIPVGGDLAKTAGKVGKFVLKNIDDIAKVSDILEFLVKNLPDALPYLADSDEFADAMKQLSKVDTSKLTKKDADVINEALEKAGMSEYAIKKSIVTNITYPSRRVDEVLDGGFLKNANAIKDKLPTWAKNKGNFGYSEVDIDGLDNTQFFAHSSIQTVIPSVKDSGISIKPESSPFKTVEVNGSNVINGEGACPRDVDTEYKILSDIQSKLGDNPSASGKIKLYTELEPCPSCQGVIEQFKEMYPNIDIEVIYSIKK